MNVITFPKKEWEDVRSRLNGGEIVYTIRVDKEYGKYRTKDILQTEWGQKVRIISVKKIRGGINVLKIEYQFFGELTKEMLDELSNYNEMEIISLSESL